MDTFQYKDIKYELQQLQSISVKAAESCEDSLLTVSWPAAALQLSEWTTTSWTVQEHVLWPWRDSWPTLAAHVWHVCSCSREQECEHGRMKWTRSTELCFLGSSERISERSRAGPADGPGLIRHLSHNKCKKTRSRAGTVWAEQSRSGVIRAAVINPLINKCFLVISLNFFPLWQ